MKVIGVENKVGSFKDKQTGELVDYNTNYLHCTYVADKINGLGTRSFKIGKKVEFVGFDSLDKLLGKEVSIEQGFSELYGSFVKAVYLK